MRLHGVATNEVVGIIAQADLSGRDPQGRPIFAGQTDDGRRIEVVMALDERDYVITVFGEVD